MSNSLPTPCTGPFSRRAFLTAGTLAIGGLTLPELLAAKARNGEGKKETAASFDYGARLTEFTLLGNLAQHAGVGNKIEWNGSKMKVTNLADLNQWIARPSRKGWRA